MGKKKRFDAVAMVRKIRDAHYEQTKAMTPEERLAFFQEEARKAQAELELLAKRTSTREV
jgi:hypothetical protein